MTRRGSLLSLVPWSVQAVVFLAGAAVVYKWVEPHLPPVSGVMQALLVVVAAVVAYRWLEHVDNERQRRHEESVQQERLVHEVLHGDAGEVKLVAQYSDGVPRVETVSVGGSMDLGATADAETVTVLEPHERPEWLDGRETR